MSNSSRAVEGFAPRDESHLTTATEPEDQRPETRDRQRVQCPNCCKLAPVTARQMGLLFYRCELCGSVGATPETRETA